MKVKEIKEKERIGGNSPQREIEGREEIRQKYGEYKNVLLSDEELDKLMYTIEAPKTLADIGADENLLPVIFRATKDIRDKYVLSRLAWDLGVLDEII